MSEYIDPKGRGVKAKAKPEPPRAETKPEPKTEKKGGE